MWRYLCIPALLACTACADESISGYADPDAVYVLREMNSARFAARATIRFPEEGRLEGEGPCNRYFGAQSAPYPWFEPGPIASTKRACPDLAAEAEYFDALSRATLAEVSGRHLILSNEDGLQLVFRAE